MNKRGGVLQVVLLVMVVLVFTTAFILMLVGTGALEVSDVSSQPILNTEFIPLGRTGSFAVTEFNFCSSVDDEFNCLESNTFSPGDEVYFRFIVESSVHNGEVLVVENYRLLSPAEEVILEADQNSNFNVELVSSGKIESIFFKDFFFLSEDSELGEYTLELLVRNPLLGSEVSLTKKFDVSDEGLI